MHDIDRLLTKIKNFREKHGLSVNGMATISGVPQSTMRKMILPDWSPTARTIRRIEIAMKVFEQKKKALFSGEL